MRRLGVTASVPFITRTTAACSGSMITTLTNTTRTAASTTAATPPSAPSEPCCATPTTARTNATIGAVTLDAAGVWVGGGGGAMRAAVEAVLHRCRCDEIEEQSSSVDSSHTRGNNTKRESAAVEEDTVKAGGGAVGPMVVAMVLRAVYKHFSTPHYLRNNNNNRHPVPNQTLTRLSEDIIYGNWEDIVDRFNEALETVPALQGYALPAEEIAAVARDVGHPLRRLVNQISYAEHGAVDVSGLYRQVRHAAYAPPVVVPDAEVAAFAQCLLQQTGALEHALTHCNEHANAQKTLLHIFNQAVRASVPTCAQWAFTDAMIAEVTAAARAMIAAGSAGDNDTTANKWSCPEEIAAEEAKRKAVKQRAITAAARRVLDALVAANGRILGTIIFAGGSVFGGCTTPAAAFSASTCSATRTQPPLLSWFTSMPGKAARADTIYVRAVYEQIWELLSDPKQSFGWDLPGTASAYLLLVGSPGIGKSWALNYLLYKAVTEERAGCPKRLVMLWGVGGLWAFLPDGRVIHGGLRGPTHQHPPKELIKALVARYAPAPADPSGHGPKATAATADATSSSTAALPALLLYDLNMERVDSFHVPNMITVVATCPPMRKTKDIEKYFCRSMWTLNLPPWGEHEFKAFFKGHPNVERTLDEIKKSNTTNVTMTPIAVDEAAADALVAEEFEKYGGVLQGAFDGQQASRLQHALEEAVAEAVVAGLSDNLDHFYWHNESVHTAAARLMSIFPEKLEPREEWVTPLPVHEYVGYSVGFRSKYIESLFKQQLERAIALVAVRREMDKLGCPREY